MIDSLLTEISNTKEDTAKVNLFAAIMLRHVYYKPEEGLTYQKTALELAQKIIAYIHQYTLNKIICRNVEKIANNSRKYLLNVKSDICRWNVDKYATFFYSLLTLVEKF